MAYTAPTFTTTAVVNGNTKVKDLDEQVNILMEDVGEYLENTQQELIDETAGVTGYTKAEADILLNTKINALMPYSGYTQVSKKLDNFVFQEDVNFTYKVADKNRYVKFEDKVVDTYEHTSYDATNGGVIADFTDTIADVAEVITDGSNTTSVAVGKGEYVVRNNIDTTDHTNTTYRATEDAPSGTALTNTAYFEDRTSIGVTNQALALPKYNDSTSAFEGISTEVAFADISKEDMLSNETILANNGFSKISDFLYSKGTSKYLASGLYQSYNKGLYHWVFNPMGTKKASDDKYWDDTTVEFTCVADCFTDSKLLTASGYVASGKSGRPDGKYYDVMYANDFQDLRQWAKVLTDLEIQSIKDDKIANGVEEMVSVQYGSQQYGDSASATAVGVDIDITALNIGDTLSFQQADGSFQVRTISSKPYYIDGFGYRADVSVAYTRLIGQNVMLTVTKPILSSKTKLSIDLIGSPDNYPQVLLDRLASGVGCVGVNPLLVGESGENYIPDGTTINWKLSNKNLLLGGTSKLNGIQVSVDNGTTWLERTDSYTFDGITNAFVGLGHAVGTIQVSSYTSSNNPYIQTTPQPVIDVTPKAIGSNSHSIYKGALIGNQISGKIATGDGTNGYESRTLENVLVDENDDIQTTPQHNTISLNSDTTSSAKWFTVLEENDETALSGVYGEEMIYDTTFGDGDDFEQLTNGTLTDSNGNTVRTFHGSIALNGKVK